VEEDDVGMTIVAAVEHQAVSLDEASRFIWAEAELLDSLDYRSWLLLWSPDGMYIVPIDRDDGDPAARLNLAYDDAAMREARVRRLLSGFSMSAAPPARTIRTTSRFVVQSSDAETINLRCAQVLVEYKYERTRILAADVEYAIVRHDGALLLHRKSVRLINSDFDQFGIGYLL
jgi:3-phenylpropionate/cinnamic acid dioxygenase small subunit